MSDPRSEADCVSFSEQTSTFWLDEMLSQLAKLVRHRVREFEKASEVSPLAEVLRDFPTVRLGASLDLPDMTLIESLATAVALAAELQPHMFDEAISSELQSAGNHPRIGGARGRESRAFLPTGETLLFLAGAQTVADKLQVMRRDRCTPPGSTSWNHCQRFRRYAGQELLDKARKQNLDPATTRARSESRHRLFQQAFQHGLGLGFGRPR